MEINLNKNSFTPRLYKWFYNVDYLPQNLCPYFWKVVIMYILLPFLGIPILIGQLAEKDSNAFVKTGVGIILIVLSIFLISTIISPIVLFNYLVLHVKPNEMYGKIMELGLTIWFPLIVFGIWTACEKSYEYITNRKKPIPEESNVVVAFVKAKFHQICPSINWK